MSIAAPKTKPMLQLPTPLSAFVVSGAVFGFFHLTSPFSYVERYEYSSWCLLGANLIALWGPVLYVGLKQRTLCHRLRTTDASISAGSFFLNLGVWMMLSAAILGGLLKAYDLFFVRGLTLTANVNELYEQNAEVSASIAGLIASLMYPLAYPTLVVVLAIRRVREKPSWIWRMATLLSLLAFAVAPLNAVVLGKRGAVFSVAILVTLAYFFFGMRVRLRTAALATIGGIVLLVFSSSMLRHRLELKGASTEGAVEVGRFTDLMLLSNEFRSIARHGGMPDGCRGAMYDWAAFHAYVVHAVPEYLHAVEQFNTAEHQYGKYTFSLAAKFFSYFVKVHYDAAETASVPPRTYIYSTLFGPFYFDFGLFSPIASFLLGLFFVSVYRFAEKTTFAVPLYLYLYTVMLLCPMISFIEMFYGFYYLVACIIGGIGLKFFSLIRRTNAPPSRGFRPTRLHSKKSWFSVR